MRIVFMAALLCLLLASAQLAVAVSPMKVTGRKAIVPLAMKNGFAEKITSQRAVIFLLVNDGKLLAGPPMDDCTILLGEIAHRFCLFYIRKITGEPRRTV